MALDRWLDLSNLQAQSQSSRQLSWLDPASSTHFHRCDLLHTVYHQICYFTLISESIVWWKNALDHSAKKLLNFSKLYSLYSTVQAWKYNSVSVSCHFHWFLQLECRELVFRSLKCSYVFLWPPVLDVLISPDFTPLTTSRIPALLVSLTCSFHWLESAIHVASFCFARVCPIHVLWSFTRGHVHIQVQQIYLP